MISKPTTAKQIDDWRKSESETENLEFKEAKNQFGFVEILSYCVAIANERGGILLLGVSNKPPRPVVGTRAYPSVDRLKKDILDRLHFRVDVEAVAHPDGRVLVFHIPSRPTGRPYHLDGAYFMRTGESLVPMTSDHLQQIFDEELSPLAKRILYMVAALVAVIVLLFVYLGVEHMWRTELKPHVGGATNETVPVVKTPEQSPKKGAVGLDTPLSSSKAKRSSMTGRVDWHDKHYWRENLKVGMTKSEVRTLFGEAESVRVTGDMETWTYGSGDITFTIDDASHASALYSWSEPD